MGLSEHLHVRLAVLTCFIKHDIWISMVTLTTPAQMPELPVMFRPNWTKQETLNHHFLGTQPCTGTGRVVVFISWWKSDFICQQICSSQSTGWTTRAVPDPSTSPSAFPSQTTTTASCGKHLPAHFLKGTLISSGSEKTSTHSFLLSAPQKVSFFSGEVTCKTGSWQQLPPSHSQISTLTSYLLTLFHPCFCTCSCFFPSLLMGVKPLKQVTMSCDELSSRWSHHLKLQ